MNPNANVSQSNLLQQRLTQQRMGVSQAGPQMQPRPGQQQMMVNLVEIFGKYFLLRHY